MLPILTQLLLLFLCIQQTYSLQCITTHVLNSQMRLVKDDIQVGGENTASAYTDHLLNSAMCSVLETLVW